MWQKILMAGGELGVIILAAGQGKRMQSETPKILHELGGVPMIVHVLRAVMGAVPQSRVAIVVGYKAQEVEAAIRTDADLAGLSLSFVRQAEQKGTGHAARCAMQSPWGKETLAKRMSVLVLPGDLPLVTSELVTQVTQPLGRSEVMRLLSCDLSDPTGYGRVVRRGKTGPVLRIVEERDANVREKALIEVGTSIYTFQSAFLAFGLEKLSDKNAQHEYYLTDLVAQAARTKKGPKNGIDVLKWKNSEDLRGINDPWELALARKILNERQIKLWSQKGVQFADPSAAWIDVRATLAPGISIGPGVSIEGRTQIGAGCMIQGQVVLRNARIGPNVTLKVGSIVEQSTVQAGAQVGPYAHLRPDSEVGPDCKVGNFVELKKTRLGAHTSVAHLSYLGDAEVGKNVNIGCGFVTCNFDGRVIDGQRKHRTVIEDDAFVGSDCQVVAPIRIGQGAYIASGSTVTEDVEAGSLAIARSRQTNKVGYAKKLKGE